MGTGPTIIVFSSLAALAAVIGVLPFTRGGRVRRSRLGRARALAGGVMLGCAYGLALAIPPCCTLSAFLGALVGCGLLFAVGARVAPGETDDNRTIAKRLAARDALHAAVEGVALGVAVLVDPELGLVMALTLALHNIPEATTLIAAIGPRSLAPRRQIGLVLLVKAPQVALAIAVFAIVSASPGSLPALNGLAIGALVYLVLADLLPAAYEEAGQTSIALVVSAAMGAVVLLQAAILG